MNKDLFDMETIEILKKEMDLQKSNSQKSKGKKVFINGKEYIEKTLRKSEWTHEEYKKHYGLPRMILTRKIARNMAKKSQGNNRIRRKWRKFQIERYGASEWCRNYNKCNCNNKSNYITPESALKI